MTSPRKKPGPKPKITDDDRERVLGALGVGGSLADAAGLIGVNPSTLRRLKAKDAEFARGVKTAEKSGKLRLLEKIANAPSWQAAAWMMERKYGAEYGRKDHHVHTGKSGGPIETLTKHAIDYDQLRKDLEEFASGGTAGGRVSANGNGQPVHSDNAN